jgi:hypothetical protein
MCFKQMVQCTLKCVCLHMYRAAVHACVRSAHVHAQAETLIVLRKLAVLLPVHLSVFSTSRYCSAI